MSQKMAFLGIYTARVSDAVKKQVLHGIKAKHELFSIKMVLFVQNV